MKAPAASSSAKQPDQKKPKTPEERARANRETVESVVVAVVLALLFRAFVAEAFVIPTGSMAPTLQGRHMDVWCPKCNYNYRTGASEENDGRGEVHETTCPICRYRMVLNKRENWDDRSFNGDRILVSKFAYAIAEPSRWDVIVFKYPGNAKQNYIKRLIGLPNELITIRHGNIYVSKRLFKLPWAAAPLANDLPDAVRKAFADHGIALSPHVTVRADQRDWLITDSESSRVYRATRHQFPEYNRDELLIFDDTRQIARKPPHKLRAMLHTVDDTNYIAPELTAVNWPSRWADRSEQPQWAVEDNGHRFVHAGGAGTHWLRYRHVVPRTEDWTDISEGHLPKRLATFPGQLITDYYAYNDSASHRTSKDKTLGCNWVGDLGVEGAVQVQGATGHVLLEAVKAGVKYQARINVADGMATLSIDEGQGWFSAGDKRTHSPQGRTRLVGPGSYRLRLTNVDDEVRLWVNDSLVEFDGPTTYTPSGPNVPRWSPTDAGDLEPLGVGAEGVGLTVTNLRVLRDVYYIATSGELRTFIWDNRYTGTSDFDFSSEGQHGPYAEIQQILSKPNEWATTPLFSTRREVRFVLSDDQFFPMGDNSPESADGRTWTPFNPDTPANPFLSRELLIGKALVIYWPHSWWTPPFINFRRMGLIR